MSLWPVAAVTFLEGIRNRAIYGITIFALLLLIASNLVAGMIMQEVGKDSTSGGTDRMTERDAGTVDVDAVEVLLGQAPPSEAAEDLGRESLVQLDEVDIRERE